MAAVQGLPLSANPIAYSRVDKEARAVLAVKSRVEVAAPLYGERRLRAFGDFAGIPAKSKMNIRGGAL